MLGEKGDIGEEGGVDASSSRLRQAGGLCLQVKLQERKARTKRRTNKKEKEGPSQRTKACWATRFSLSFSRLKLIQKELTEDHLVLELKGCDKNQEPVTRTFTSQNIRQIELTEYNLAPKITKKMTKMKHLPLQGKPTERG